MVLVDPEFIYLYVSRLMSGICASKGGEGVKCDLKRYRECSFDYRAENSGKRASILMIYSIPFAKRQGELCRYFRRNLTRCVQGRVFVKGLEYIYHGVTNMLMGGGGSVQGFIIC